MVFSKKRRPRGQPCQEIVPCQDLRIILRASLESLNARKVRFDNHVIPHVSQAAKCDHQLTMSGLARNKRDAPQSVLDNAETATWFIKFDSAINRILRQHSLNPYVGDKQLVILTLTVHQGNIIHGCTCNNILQLGSRKADVIDAWRCRI